MHVVTGPKNAASQKERLHREAAPGQGGGVCDVVGDDDGIGRQPPGFLKFFEAIFICKGIPIVKR